MNYIYILIGNLSSIISFIYFFYIIYLSKKNSIYKVFAFLFLLLGIWTIINTLFIIKNQNYFFQLLPYNIEIIFNAYLTYLFIFFSKSKKNNKRIFIFFNIIYSIMTLIMLFISFKTFLLLYAISKILILLNTIATHFNIKKDRFQNYIAKNYIISILLSFVIYFIINFIFYKRLIQKYIYTCFFIYLFYYFPIIFNTLFLIQIREFLMFFYIGGKWQNFIMNKVDIPYVYTNSENQIVYTNESFHKISGFDKNLSKKKFINEILDFDNSILKCKEGVIPIEYEIYPIKFKNEFSKMIVIRSLKELMEITEKKQIEEEFLLKYNKFEILFDKLLNIFPKAIALLNEKGRFENVNNNFLNIFKIQREDIIGKFVDDFFNKIKIKIENQEIINSNINEIKDYLLNIINKKTFQFDGKQFYIEIKEIRQNQKSNEISLSSSKTYFIIIKDYSNIYNIKVELQKNITIIKQFFVKNQLPICITDRDGFIIEENEKFSYRFGNILGTNIFSFDKSVSNIIKKRIKDLYNQRFIHIGDYLLVKNKFESIKRINKSNFNNKSFFEKGELKKLELEEENKIYSIYCYYLFKYFNYPLCFDDDYHGYFIFVDITDLIIKERELLENLRNSQNISKRINILTNNINHEIRSPVNVISGFIELLKFSDIMQNFEDELNVLSSNIENVKKIIDEVISISSFFSKDKNEIEINLKPILEDYKNFIKSRCNFNSKIEIPINDNLNIKINILIFKKLISFILEKFQDFDFVELSIFIYYQKYKKNSNKSFLIINLQEKKKENILKIVDNIDLIKIILEHLVFLLKGTINFSSNSLLNFEIKIPIKIKEY